MMISCSQIWHWPRLLIIFFFVSSTYGQICSVFQPFKVTPDNAKFQIGGPFPLHTEDCLHIRPDVVQELIGVQWALSHWNQNPKNANAKLALSAFDTCSRGPESLTQTMTFLHESGYFNPKECQNSGQSNGRIPLGLIMPMAQDGRLKGLKEALLSMQIPLIAYSGSTAQALFDADVPTVFSTAATLDHFMEASIAILKSMPSDLITLIYSDQHVAKSTLEKQLLTLSKSKISKSKISISKTISILNSKSMINPNLTEIIFMIVSKKEAIDYFMTTPHLEQANSTKLFVLLPALGESWTQKEVDDFLMPKNTSYRLILIQQTNRFSTDDFRDYFLDILKNNYESYVLLATYMQQEHNCTLIGTDGMIDCADVEIDDMIKTFTMNRQVESAVLTTYVYGDLAKYLAADVEDVCATVGPICTRKILAYLKDRMSYTFGEFDPPAYSGFVARFGEDRTLNSLPIEGLYVSRDTEFRMQSILNHTTGTILDTNKIHSSTIRWSNGRPIRIRCNSWRPECQTCTKEQKYTGVSDRLWLEKSSDIYLMGLFDMRHPSITDLTACNRSIDDPKSLTMPAAFVYVLENIRNKYPQSNLLPNLELGGLIFDSCHDRISTIETLVASSTDRCFVVGDHHDTIPSKNIAAFVSGQRGFVNEMVKRIFQQKPRKPFLASEQKIDSANYDTQSKAILALLQRQNWNYVSVLLSEQDDECQKAYESFRRLAESSSICIGDVVHAKTGDRIESIRNTNSPTTKIHLAFTTSQDTILLLKTRQSYRSAGSQDESDQKPIYIFTGDAHDWEIDARQENGVRTWKQLALGSLSIQSHRAIDANFRSFLNEKMNPKKFNEKWLIQFWEDYFQCSIKSDGSIGGRKKICSGDEKLNIERFSNGRMTKEAKFIDAIENFIFALDNFYKKACPNKDGLCESFFDDDYSKNMTEIMDKMEKEDQYFIYNYRSNLDNINGGAYVEIATWSPSKNLKFNDTWTWYDSDRRANYTVPESKCRPPQCKCRFDQTSHTSDENENLLSVGNEDISTNKFGQAQPPTGDQWKKQLWTYIFLIITTILLLAAVLVLTVVSVKLCCGVVKGNQSLGICLLFGVIFLYLTAYFFIFDPCEILCRLRYIGHSFSYSIIFGCMIAKAVQLRNSETLGFNGYISYWNYWLLLFFITAVQLALNIQWLLVRRSVVVSLVQDASTKTPTILLRCSWTNDEFLSSQIYVIILLCMASFLALLNRNVKRNYQETRWLMYTSFICAGTWASWMIGYALTPEPFKDTVVVMELIVCATIVLCFMFGPKLYILLKYESMLIDYPKLPTTSTTNGNGGSGGEEKRNSLAFPTIHQNQTKEDIGIHHFDDDLGENDDDGRRSAMSSSGGSIKSVATSLTYTLSSVGSTDSTAPVVMRKKKNQKKKNSSGSINIESVSIDGEMKNRSPSTILEETVSSVH